MKSVAWRISYNVLPDIPLVHAWIREIEPSTAIVDRVVARVWHRVFMQVFGEIKSQVRD
jgi:hypothetical protein